MTKRLFMSLLIAVTVVCSLFAGGSSETAEASGVVTLNISHNMDFTTIPESFVAAAERLNERYAAEGRDLRIEFNKDYQTIDWTEYQNAVTFAHRTGDAPDIFALSDVAAAERAGILLDITDVIEENADAFVPGVFEGGTIDGRIYAFAPDLPVRVIYYRKAALEAIGWTAEEIEALPGRIADGSFTFEDFIDLCQEVVDKGAARYGLVHRPGDGPDFLDVLMTLGGRYYDENGTLVFDQDALLRFFQFTYDNVHVKGITPPNLNQMGWTTINAMVGTGEAFAYYGPVYSANYVYSSVNMSAEEFSEVEEFVLFPKSEYTDAPFAVAAPQWIGISADTEYPEICKDLIRELVASPEILAHHAGTINTLSSEIASNSEEEVTFNPLIGDITYMTDYSITTPAIEGLGAYRSELFRQIVALELGQTTPEKALSDMRTQVELSVPNVIIE